MSKCIECKCPAIQLFDKQKIREKARTSFISLCDPLNSQSITRISNKDGVVKQQRRWAITVISSHLISSFTVEAFPTTTSLSLAAVAKPADPAVLLQTSALLISLYLIANFVVPQLLSKSLGFDKDKVDENNKPKQ